VSSAPPPAALPAGGKDVLAVERTREFKGRYHVLGATLSPLDGVGPQDLTIDALVARAHDSQVSEIVLALNATVDGQTTAHYITDLLQDANVKVTRLAHGVPVGPTEGSGLRVLVAKVDPDASRAKHARMWEAATRAVE